MITDHTGCDEHFGSSQHVRAAIAASASLYMQANFYYTVRNKRRWMRGNSLATVAQTSVCAKVIYEIWLVEKGEENYIVVEKRRPAVQVMSPKKKKKKIWN